MSKTVFLLRFSCSVNPLREAWLSSVKNCFFCELFFGRLSPSQGKRGSFSCFCSSAIWSMYPGRCIVLNLTSVPRHDSRPRPGGSRTAANCQRQARRPNALPLHYRGRLFTENAVRVSIFCVLPHAVFTQMSKNERKVFFSIFSSWKQPSAGNLGFNKNCFFFPIFACPNLSTKRFATM